MAKNDEELLKLYLLPNCRISWWYCSQGSAQQHEQDRVRNRPILNELPNAGCKKPIQIMTNVNMEYGRISEWLHEKRHGTLPESLVIWNEVVGGYEKLRVFGLRSVVRLRFELNQNESEERWMASLIRGVWILNRKECLRSCLLCIASQFRANSLVNYKTGITSFGQC